MNLTLSRRGDYVVRSAICLARSYGSGRPTKLREISEEMAVPRTFVSQILGDLVRAGLARSSFGTHGGYRLTRSPETVSLLEVVEAGEGALESTAVAPDDKGHGDALPDGEGFTVPLVLRQAWGRAGEALRQVLAETTLASVAGTPAEHARTG